MRIQLREPRSKHVVLGFAGDTVPGRSADKPIDKNQDLLKLLGTCDQVVANLESTLTEAPSVKDRGITLRSDPSTVGKLKELNVNVTNLANNHIMDCGHHGLTETLNVLAKNEIQWFGAGKDLKQASSPFILEFSAGRIAFLAYSYKAWDVPSTAAVNSPGANPLNLEDAKRQIGALRDKGFIVCTSYHGGNEHFRIPNPKYMTILRELVKAGANLVIGHHAHVFQGIEIYKNSIIAYGLGNFFVEWRRSKIEFKKRRGENVGLFLTLEIDQMGAFAYSVNFVHNHWPRKKMSIVQGKKKAELLSLFNHISRVLADPAKYDREWRRDCFRLVIGANDENKIQWLQRLPGRVYSFCKFIFRVFISRNESKMLWSPDHSMVSIYEIYSAAIRGIPTKISASKTLRSCYKAYEMEEDG